MNKQNIAKFNEQTNIRIINKRKEIKHTNTKINVHY